MKIAGIQKLSLIDYPGKLSCVVFTQGCNFRCPYCHNPRLVYPQDFEPCLDIDDIFSFLKARRGKLDAVVVSGGEPTLQRNLVHFVLNCKKLDFLVKLDTNGSNPGVLEFMFRKKLVDYVAMDIKAPFDKYHTVCGCAVDISMIKRSMQIIETSGIEYQFRTTFDTSLMDSSDIKRITHILSDPMRYTVQECIHPEFVCKS